MCPSCLDFVSSAFWLVRAVFFLRDMSFDLDLKSVSILGEKRKDLTQSYDKSSYTHRKLQKAKWQYKKTPPKLRLHSDCGPT